ncbi:unnamed protein product [Rotaria sp. Silwood1]|nr:unnamed protein product [Rotaria sp. Silwood1]
MMKELSFNRALVSSVFGILPAVTLGAGPIATVFTNMYSCRTVAIAGTCIASFGFFLSRLWVNIWFYYITIGVIGGIDFALMYLPAIVSVGLYFEQKRAFAMGIAVCGSGVGTFVLSYIMNEMVNIRSWVSYTNALLVEAGIVLFGLLCGSLMFHRIPFLRLVESMLPDITSEKSSTKSFLDQLIEQIDLNLLKISHLHYLLYRVFLTSLGFNAVYNFAGDLANDSKVIKDQRTYIVMSIGLSNIFGRLIIGYLGDQKWVKKPWFKCQFHDANETSIKKPDEFGITEKDYAPLLNINDVVVDRIQGSLFGLAVGDALGAHVEFRPHDYLVDNPVKDLVGGGTWGLARGQFTDDTSMALCLAISLIARQDFVAYDQLVRYKWWYRHGYMSSTGHCFDIGAATKDSIVEFEKRQKNFSQKHNIPLDQIDFLSDRDLIEAFNVECSQSGVAGNGALMRLVPVPIFFFRDPVIAVEYSGISGKITHGDDKVYDACSYYGALIIATLNGTKKEELLSENFYDNHLEWFGGRTLHSEVMTIVRGSYKQKVGGYKDGIRGKGYIINALEAALWAFWTDDNCFEKGALNAVNLGDDTDTTAAIYGQLAGAYYGYKELPKKWSDSIYAKNFILCVSSWIAYEGEQWTINQKAPDTDHLITFSNRTFFKSIVTSSMALTQNLATKFKTTTLAQYVTSNTILRKAIDSSNRIGYLYDGWQDCIIESSSIRLITNENYSYPPVKCVIKSGKKLENRNILRLIDCPGDLRLSVLSNLVKPTGIALVVDYPFEIDECTRIFYYSYLVRKEAVIDEKSIQKQGACKIPATHVITAMDWGIDVVVLLTLPPDESEAIDAGLDQIRHCLNIEESLRQISIPDFNEVKSYTKPPLACLSIFEDGGILLNPSKKVWDWTDDKRLISGGKNDFLERLFNFDKTSINNHQLERLESILAQHECEPDALACISFLCSKLLVVRERGRGRGYARGPGSRGGRRYARGPGSRGGRGYVRGRGQSFGGRWLQNERSDSMDVDDQQTVSVNFSADLDINADPKPFFVDPKVTLDQHIQAQMTNLPRYVAALFTLNENSVEIGQKAKACALAAAWCRHDHTLANNLLRHRQLFTLTEVLKAVMMLDAGRQLRAYEKQIKRLELSKKKPKATTLGKMKNNIDNLNRLKASTGSVSGAVARHIQRWTRTLTQQELEYFALHMPTESWKKLADVVHFNPSKDFPALPWFLPFCFGTPAPEETMVARCRTLTNENVNDLIKEFKIPYSHLKQFKDHLNDKSKTRIAAYEEKLDTILWYYEDLQCPDVDDVISERLENGEEISLPYGKLMERLLLLRKLRDTPSETAAVDNIQDQNSVQSSKNKCYSYLLSVAEGQLAKIKLPLASPVAVMGDASYSMDVAIRTATILASLLTAVCSAKLNFFHTKMFLPAFTPKNIEDVLTLALTTKAHGLTANAAGLVSYYDNKEIIKTFIMVTDEIENTDVHTADGTPTRFFNLFMKYRSEVYPAKLVFISFLDNQHDQGQMYTEFLNANVPDVIQFKFNGQRPDLTKIDNLLGLLSTDSSQTFSDQLEKLQNEFEQSSIESIMTSLINKQTNNSPSNEV